MVLEIETRRVEPDIVIVQLTGDIMSREIRRIETVVEDFLREGRRKFIFDTAGVLRSDSVGVGMIVLCWQKVTQVGGVFRIVDLPAKHGWKPQYGFCNPVPLSDVIPFYETVEGASEGLGGDATPGSCD